MANAAATETVDEKQANQELASAYRACADPTIGHPANIMKVHGLHPKSMLAHRELYRTLMFGPSPFRGTSER